MWNFSATWITERQSAYSILRVSLRPVWDHTLSYDRTVKVFRRSMNFLLEYRSRKFPVSPSQCPLPSTRAYRLHTTDTRLQHLIREHMPDIANSIVLEQGKTFADAQGDVHRGLQVVESATAITTTMLGDKLEVTKDMDTYSRRLPLGVCAAITPFNFPAM